MNVSKEMAQRAAIEADGSAIRCIWFRNRRDGWAWDYEYNLKTECPKGTKVYWWTGFGWRLMR
jgi:hypothetical protein